MYILVAMLNEVPEPVRIAITTMTVCYIAMKGM